jgi:hypothetical protein
MKRVIAAQVGTGVELVDGDVFSDVHAELARHFRALGFTGRDLDEAICRSMPSALEFALYGDRGTLH